MDLHVNVKLFSTVVHSVSVESVGSVPPASLFIESIRALKAKCKKFIDEIDKVPDY